MNERFSSIWDAIEDDPVDREKLKLQSQLMHVLCAVMKSERLTQKDAGRTVFCNVAACDEAYKLVNQPRVFEVFPSPVGSSIS